MSERIWRCVFAALAVTSASGAWTQTAGKQFYAQEVAGMPELPAPLPSGATVSFDPAESADGNGSVRIDYTGSDPQSVVLYEVPNPGAEDCAVWCKATVRGEKLENVA